MTLKQKLHEFNRFLGPNPWFAGDNITFVDFSIYEWLEQARILAPNVVGEFKSIQEFLERFEQLPKIKEYMESERFLKRPFNMLHAAYNPK